MPIDPVMTELLAINQTCILTVAIVTIIEFLAVLYHNFNVEETLKLNVNIIML